MHLLILGGSGFVGSRLVKHFLTLPEWTVDAPGSSECDLTNPSAVQYIRQRVGNQSSILFCSTISRLRDDSLKSYGQNVKMAENLATALKEAEFHSLVFCSSIDVYGRPPVENPIDEGTPLNPTGYYGYSKLVSEYILRRELSAHQGLAILRLPGIYSLDNDDPSPLGRIYNNLRYNNTIQLSAGGNQVRTYLSVGELVRVIEDIIKRRWSGLVNLGSSESYSIRDCARLMKEFLGSASAIVNTPANGSEFDIIISGDKVRREFPSVKMSPLSQYMDDLQIPL
jgi:nucleoside-diphosphate-sugar epimerase